MRNSLSCYWRRSARWDLVLGKVLEKSGTGYVCSARNKDAQPVVLKVAFPHDEHFSGVEAMRVYSGQGCVRLLDSSEDGTQVIMERIVPGTPLFALEDEHEEVRIAAAVIRRLHRPPPHTGWVESGLRAIYASEQSREMLPKRLVTALEQSVADLEELDRPVVLHGDLHHENILQHRETAIDPKGVIGDPALEVGRYIGNRLQRWAGTAADEHDVIDRRLAVFSGELGEPIEAYGGSGCRHYH